MQTKNKYIGGITVDKIFIFNIIKSLELQDAAEAAFVFAAALFFTAFQSALTVMNVSHVYGRSSAMIWRRGECELSLNVFTALNVVETALDSVNDTGLSEPHRTQ